MGKTSLLQYVAQRAPDRSLFFDAMCGASPAEMGKHLESHVRERGRDYPGSVLGQARFNPQSDVSEVVEKLAQAAEHSCQHTLLLWDEAERLLDLDEACLARLRGAFQRSTYLRTVIAATKRLSELNDRCRNSPMPSFLSIFDIRYIPPLTRTEAARLIRQEKDQSGPIEVSEQLQDEIMDATGNHPYLIQLLCRRLFRDGKLRVITEEDYRVDAFLANVFQQDYNSLSPTEQKIVRRLSKLGEVGFRRLRWGIRLNGTQLRRHLVSLQQLGHVQRNGGRYQIANCFLATSLKEGLLRDMPQKVSDQASLEVDELGEPSAASSSALTAFVRRLIAATAGLVLGVLAKLIAALLEPFLLQGSSALRGIAVVVVVAVVGLFVTAWLQRGE
jgi:hypothetical protein